MSAIRRDLSINPSRGDPIGVHVESSPFGAATSGGRQTGAAGHGAYIEFDMPSNFVETRIWANQPRTTGVIPSNGPLNIQHLNPNFVKPFWRF